MRNTFKMLTRLTNISGEEEGQRPATHNGCQVRNQGEQPSSPRSTPLPTRRQAGWHSLLELSIQPQEVEGSWHQQ